MSAASSITPPKMQPLIDQVIEITRSLWTDAYVALYAYGSTARDEMDAWSDLDVCLIAPSGDHLPAIRAWMTRMGQEFGQKVDPIGLPENLLGEEMPWDLSFVPWSLRENAQLLMGRDIRDKIQMPCLRKMQLSSAMVTMASVRRVYGIRRDRALPKNMLRPTIARDWTCSAGNIAWAICSSLMHLLRSILFFEHRTLASTKAAIHTELLSRGETVLAEHVKAALDIRKQIPRYDALQVMPSSVEELAAAIPGLLERFRGNLSNAGLQDPSYEPNGQPLYEADGSLRQQLPTL